MVVIKNIPANAGNINAKWALRMEHSSNRFSVSMKQNTREFSLLSVYLRVLSSVCLPHRPPCVRTHGEAILRRKSSYQNLTFLVPWSGTSSPQSCEEINFWCLFHWVYYIVLWNSRLTNTNSIILEIKIKKINESKSKKLSHFLGIFEISQNWSFFRFHHLMNWRHVYLESMLLQPSCLKDSIDQSLM